MHEQRPPLSIRLRNGLVARNRVWLAPLTNQQSHDDGVLSTAEQRWLERRAEGGFGVVETCAAHVSQDGQGFDGQLGVWGDHQLPRLRELAAAIAQAGALGLVQLYHGGVRSPSRLTGRRPWSASSFTEAGRPDFEVPRAAEVSDIEAAIDAFEQAARRTAAAGFHGVELHGAHGYLLGQFLSGTMNQRTDEWGGSFANRARLIRTIARRVRAATPAEFLVGARISLKTSATPAASTSTNRCSSPPGWPRTASTSSTSRCGTARRTPPSAPTSTPSRCSAPPCRSTSRSSSPATSGPAPRPRPSSSAAPTSSLSARLRS
ncbi:hypothetical protein [Nannocystis pusilla]|uniref:oxidoreductase n=1 Tax=Nannocystis pusilla TaxID=889268 RepID=UPI003B78C281